MDAPATRTPSPSKRRRIDGSVEDTPRAMSIRPAPSLASSEQSFISRRSQSPEKKIKAMRSAPQPVELQQFHERREEIPDELKTMLRIIDGRLSRGIRVISNEYENEIAGIKTGALGAINAYDFVYADLDDLPGPSPTPRQCAKAVWLAARCETKGCSEAAWNSSVHNYILDLALYTKPFMDQVYFVNCTSAQIAPSSLIPPSDPATASQGKMTDFAITVEPSDRFKEAFNTRFRGKTAKSVNHTLHEPLTHCPIGVSIETKRTGEKWKEAVYQLEIWTAAQFNKLEELMEEVREMRGEQETGGTDASGLPFLPVIIVQGHQWKFLAAVRYPGKRTCLYEEVTFGSTNSALGVYQIVATIQLLARWTRDVFASWFERECMNMTPEPLSTSIIGIQY
ncbi:uncharacterized protein BDZ99DRAFT_459582 [Mytilinidion resinicola]|uniref:PD-(D/E)XK nuclease-like domain-containing protein n=1 Tax=Mytilinidion resinicola TaxID=574789 RepID=A0A6A6YYC8_9PEZI|nr:uncharacterized protein BDZ99DRAFT_459582 [Mytilinidion resinicola]KAF2813831.1 hypothetical protein BDZ99DRAFT_459582 [Mytilinidion resinicola]